MACFKNPRRLLHRYPRLQSADGAERPANPKYLVSSKLPEFHAMPEFLAVGRLGPDWNIDTIEYLGLHVSTT